jgi:hypothetical protein
MNDGEFGDDMVFGNCPTMGDVGGVVDDDDDVDFLSFCNLNIFKLNEYLESRVGTFIFPNFFYKFLQIFLTVFEALKKHDNKS